MKMRMGWLLMENKGEARSSNSFIQNLLCKAFRTTAVFLVYKYLPSSETYKIHSMYSAFSDTCSIQVAIKKSHPTCPSC